MPEGKCDGCIGELAAVIEDGMPEDLLREFIGSEQSIDSMARLVLVTLGDNPEFKACMKALVKPGGTENDPARRSAIREALRCIGYSNGWLETERDVERVSA